jgi:tungstate transport system permease protein
MTRDGVSRTTCPRGDSSGSVLVVGVNIAGADGTSVTRTLTTAIQLEARQERFGLALVLGAVLVATVLTINGIVLRFGGGRT